ncbi:hypothetical protein M569_10411, partial [Genlisea aurea]
FLLLLITILSSSYSQQSSDIIQRTCENTKYYDLCVSSLISDASTEHQTDPKGLALIILDLARANATATNSYLTSQMSSNFTAKAAVGVMKECRDRYGYAVEALANGARDVAAELYDLAYLHVMAAADYPTGCRFAFRRYGGIVYPGELATRENQLRQICDVAMEIIDGL